MMHAAWQGLISNLAVIGALVIFWANVRSFFRPFGRHVDSIAFGMAMGTAAVLAMCLSFEIAPGMLFDLRVVPIAMAGLFGGPLTVLIAAVPALMYRSWLGGVGAVPAMLGMTMAAVAASGWRWRLALRPVGFIDVLAVAALSTAGFVCSWAAMPADVLRTMLATVAVPALTLSFFGIFIVGAGIVREGRRRDMVEANALYRAVIEVLPDCLNVKDLNGRFLAANPATARLMGASSPEDMIGRTDFDFYPEPTAERFRRDEAATLDAGRQVAIEQLATFGDGSTAWLSTLKVPFKNPKGKIIGMITHNRDVTSAKIMQVELENTRRQLDDALATMADGLVMYDADARITLFNEQYRGLFPRTAALRVPGVALSEVLRGSLACGEELLPDGVDAEEWIETIVERIKTEGSRVIGLADGRWLEARTKRLANGGTLSIYSDVTARRMHEQVLKFRAEHDPLTGLANRAAFQTRLDEIHRRARSQKTGFGILLVDLDRFKQVNDTLGHHGGDLLLVEVARRLEAACRDGDLVARLGGDEFAVITAGMTSETTCACLAQRILDRLMKPMNVGDVELLPGASIGFSVFPVDPCDPQDLLLHADEALYAAKAQGRRRWVAYGQTVEAGRQSA